jgi:aminoglycoside phosphotransferase (APT) family kinase protein
MLAGRLGDLLGQPIAAWQAAPYGADHLVLLACLQDGQRVVIKAGSEAHVDGWVLPQLGTVGVKAPALIAEAEIEESGTVYPVIVMSFIDGQLLAEVSDPLHRSLPSLMAQIHRIHRITTERGAGPVLEVVHDQHRNWKDYLLRVLTGDDPEFRWDPIQLDNRLDREALVQGIERATQLVTRLTEPERYCLLHGDLNPHNVFVDQYDVTGIVDWSYARFGDPLFDFARLRTNPFIRRSPKALSSYFAELKLDTAAREREQTYYLVNLLEYVNWYYVDNEIERVHEQLRLIRHELT